MASLHPITRRSFLAGAAALGIARTSLAAQPDQNANPPLLCFSKHLQFSRDYNELADLLAELGFDGTDLTVRKGGHVLPENVEHDLPKAVEAIRRAGLDVQMITSDIEDPGEEKTVKVLQTAYSLGIKYYRIGTWSYDPKRPIFEQIEAFKPKLQKLAALNAQYNIRAGYHNHSGRNYIGGSMWDIHEIYKEVDPKWIGYNYDAAHAVAEGGAGSWEITFRLIQDRIFGVAVKDCAWEKNPQKGWLRTYPPLGEGMVDWPYVLQLLKEISFTGPFSMHFEYPIPGEGEEKRRNELQSIRRDADRFKTMLKNAGLR